MSQKQKSRDVTRGDPVVQIFPDLPPDKGETVSTIARVRKNTQAPACGHRGLYGKENIQFSLPSVAHCDIVIHKIMSQKKLQYPAPKHSREFHRRMLEVCRLRFYKIIDVKEYVELRTLAAAEDGLSYKEYLEGLDLKSREASKMAEKPFDGK